MGTSVWMPIRNELHRILLQVSGIPDVHYELFDTTPTPGVAYIREAIEKGPDVTKSLSSQGLIYTTGIYKLDLMWPRNGSKMDGENLADKIRLAFWPGRVLAGSGSDFIEGRFESSDLGSAVPGASWFQFPIRVHFWFHRRTKQGYLGS